MCTQLRSFLTEQIRNFTNEMYTEISYHFYGKNVNRNEILIRPGKTIKNLYFVNRVCLRRYFFAEDGREITKDFTFEGSFNAIPVDFLYKTPSKFDYIQALEKTELLEISYEGFDYISNRIPDFFYSLITMSYSINDDFSKASSHLGTATEKYKWLLEEKPQIIQRISDKLIASHLDISTRTQFE